MRIDLKSDRKDLYQPGPKDFVEVDVPAAFAERRKSDWAWTMLIRPAAGARGEAADGAAPTGPAG